MDVTILSDTDKQLVNIFEASQSNKALRDMVLKDWIIMKWVNLL